MDTLRDKNMLEALWRRAARRGKVVDHESDFWRGRRVFVTGHTGFKGGWLALWLARLGAEVHGFALAATDDAKLPRRV